LSALVGQVIDCQLLFTCAEHRTKTASVAGLFV